MATQFNHSDLLEHKTNFLQALEELKYRRAECRDQQTRIEKLLAQKLETEQNLCEANDKLRNAERHSAKLNAELTDLSAVVNESKNKDENMKLKEAVEAAERTVSGMKKELSALSLSKHQVENSLKQAEQKVASSEKRTNMTVERLRSIETAVEALRKQLLESSEAQAVLTRNAEAAKLLQRDMVRACTHKNCMMNELRAERDQLKKKLYEHEARLLSDSRDAKLAAKEEEISHLNKKLKMLEEQNSSHSGEVEKLLAERLESRTIAQQAHEFVRRSEADVENVFDLKTKLETYEKDRHISKMRCEEKMAEFEALRRAHDVQIGELKAQASLREERIKVENEMLRNQLDERNIKLAEAQKQSENVLVLEKALKELKTRLQTMQNEKNEADQERNTLSKTINAKTDEIADLKSKLQQNSDALTKIVYDRGIQVNVKAVTPPAEAAEIPEPVFKDHDVMCDVDRPTQSKGNISDACETDSTPQATRSEQMDSARKSTAENASVPDDQAHAVHSLNVADVSVPDDQVHEDHSLNLADENPAASDRKEKSPEHSNMNINDASDRLFVNYQCEETEGNLVPDCRKVAEESQEKEPPEKSAVCLPRSALQNTIIDIAESCRPDAPEENPSGSPPVNEIIMTTSSAGNQILSTSDEAQASVTDAENASQISLTISPTLKVVLDESRSCEKERENQDSPAPTSVRASDRQSILSNDGEKITPPQRKLPSPAKFAAALSPIPSEDDVTVAHVNDVTVSHVNDPDEVGVPPKRSPCAEILYNSPESATFFSAGRKALAKKRKLSSTPPMLDASQCSLAEDGQDSVLASRPVSLKVPKQFVKQILSTKRHPSKLENRLKPLTFVTGKAASSPYKYTNDEDAFQPDVPRYQKNDTQPGSGHVPVAKPYINMSSFANEYMSLKTRLAFKFGVSSGKYERLIDDPVVPGTSGRFSMKTGDRSSIVETGIAEDEIEICDSSDSQ